MKQYYSFSVMALLLLVAGCKQSLNEVDCPEDSDRLIIARLESDNSTKTVLTGPVDGIYYPYWSKGDELAVYADGVSAPDKYSLVDGEGSVTASFKGKVSGTQLFALYPYSFRSEEGVTNGVMSLELPSVQVYKQGSFADNAYPMVAVTSTDELSFKNLCSILKISLTGEEIVNQIIFTASDETMAVSGKGSVRTDYSDIPELIMNQGGANTVTLDCGAVQLNGSVPTDFYLVLPAGTYKGGFTIEVKTFAGSMFKSTSSDIVFKRSQIRSVPVFECKGDGTVDPDNVPYNQIWYSSDYKIELREEWFDRVIVSHEYEDGKGIITFDGPLTGIMWYAMSIPVLTEIHLPDTVESIGWAAFTEVSVKSFRVPANLKTVEDNILMGCSQLERIYGKWASEDEKALVLEDGTLCAYAYASAEPDLVIPEGVTKIAYRVFNGENVDLTKVESITLPSTFESMTQRAIGYLPNLREFRGNNQTIVDGRSLVIGGTLMAVAGKGLTDYVIPYGVNTLGSDCISGLRDLHSVTFPESVHYIDDEWNRDCDNLEFYYGANTTADHHGWAILTFNYNYSASIELKELWTLTPKCPADYHIPADEDIKMMGNQVLKDNHTIERLTIPDDVVYMGFYCLGLGNNPYTKLKVLTLPASLEQIDFYGLNGAKYLDSLYFRSYSPPSYVAPPDVEFGYIGHDGLVILVPEGTEEAYKSSPDWARYSQFIQGWHYDDLEAPDYYMSSDYSQNGKVTRLQTATEGDGIELILMGDAFSDRQVADGTYDAAMQKMMEAFFSEEPYTTYRNLFNVNAVTVVSLTEGYDHSGQALGSWFGDGTQVGGDDNKCIEYALKAVPDDKMDNALIIVAMNEDAYAGTCYMYYPSSGDCGDGLSVAYFPTSSMEVTFNGLVRHEAGGHGFSKLADEYAYEYMGAISQAAIEEAQNMAAYGWWKNVDFTGDPAKVKWAKFLSDERYRYDGLGVYEGGFTYWTGVWRPTEDSIMNHNTGGFNAPSREAIWYRIQKLAYGDSWEYNYEDFVTYDAKNRKTSAATSSARPGNYVERRTEPTHPPVVVHRRWNDPVPERNLRPAR